MNNTFPSKIMMTALLLASAPLLAVFAAENPNAGVEARVREVFADAPVMVAVAKCESGIRQFNSSGGVLMGGAGGQYVGIFQISDRVHRAYALSLGMDISTVEGNLAYARRLYDANGTRPWVSCVPAGTPVTNAPAPVPTPAPAPSPSADQPFVPVPLTAPLPTPSAQAAPAAPATFVALSVNMQSGMVHAQVRELQKALNGMGYAVSVSGAGSAGQETTRFGALTRTAVRKFQCEKMRICSGSEWTNGYGRVGPMTRAALNAAAAE